MNTLCNFVLQIKINNKLNRDPKRDSNPGPLASKWNRISCATYPLHHGASVKGQGVLLFTTLGHNQPCYYFMLPPHCDV